MKIKIEKTETVEVDVQLPLYLEHGAYLYWIISEDIWIRVLLHEILGEEATIIVYSRKPAYGDRVLTEGKKISAEYFNSIYSASLDKLSSLLPKPKFAEEEVV